MRVEHKSTDTKILPRTWWNSEETRMRDLTAVKKLLDRQEKSWNAMLHYWERSGRTDVPPPSPTSRPVFEEKKIQNFNQQS